MNTQKVSNTGPTFCFAVLLVSITGSGCQSEIDRLHGEYGDAAREKLAKVDRAVEITADLPSPSNAYQQWVAAKKKRENLEFVRQSDEIEESVKENAEDWIVEADKYIDERYEEMALRIDDSVVFRDDPDQNAATLLVASDGSDAHSDRNRFHADWYMGGLASTNPDALTKTYQRLANLRYLLVLREADIVRPEFEGSEGEHNEFSMGAIQCDAFLVDLSGLDVIHSYRFLAPNQRSALSFGEYEMVLPSDPEDAIGVLTSRLYSAAHEFGSAVLAEMSPQVVAAHEIVRDLLGVRLIRADRAPTE